MAKIGKDVTNQKEKPTKITNALMFKMIKDARIEKFAPALLFEVRVKVPKIVPHPSYRTLEETKREIAESWAITTIKMNKRFKNLGLGMGNAIAKKKSFSASKKYDEYDVIVVYRWG